MKQERRVDVNEPHRHDYKGHVTSFVIWMCVLAATGGLIYGYDIGISGGVASMDGFLEMFFPKVYRRKHLTVNTDGNYCKYDDQEFQTFTSSLYIAGIFGTSVASWTSRKFGRRSTIQMAAICFVIGTILSAGAQNLGMIIFGRIMLGVGVGFGNQSIPIYLSEMAPTNWRGGLSILFQLAVTVGIVIANLVNYGSQKIYPWGWRLSLAGVGLPSIILAIGGIFLLETPSSLIQRGRMEEGKRVLQRVRGTLNVDEEYNNIVAAAEIANTNDSKFLNILKYQNRPQLVIGMLLQMFKQMTGMNAIMFYSPLLFQTLGFKAKASLYYAVIVGGVNVLSTVVALAIVDKVGRRKLLLQGGIQMFIAQVLIAIILGLQLGDTGSLSSQSAIVVVVLICVFVSGFAWSWGPLAWLIPSETFPLGVRSTGQSITASTNLMFIFLIAQCFLSMICTMKYGIFVLFAASILIMTFFVIFFLPETKGVHIEEMQAIWANHWYWKRYMSDDMVLHPDMKNKVPHCTPSALVDEMV